MRIQNVVVNRTHVTAVIVYMPSSIRAVRLYSVYLRIGFYFFSIFPTHPNLNFHIDDRLTHPHPRVFCICICIS